MNMKDVKEKAKVLGVNPGKMKKTDLIKTIQMKEGYDACYGSGNKSCSQMECCFRSECITH
ncbi:MAG: SAP domain-containing protein [Proteobacteria bacterium]|nr:SAP domain-containing protein [Pseudomonadota bacterium]MBU1738409.1 SAP domain-containing protein [Pseudomonadota bacterium]